MTFDRTRRHRDPRDAAEAAFKKATTKPFDLPSEPKSPGLPDSPSPVSNPSAASNASPASNPSQANTVPNAKERVTLRIDRDVLEHFQESGPGWQDRINDALRIAAGK